MEDKLTAHKFKIGESVDYIFAGRHGAVGVYEVTQLMPVKDDQLQYRIKARTSPMNAWSRKVNWIGKCDRAWHRPALRTETKSLATGANCSHLRKFVHL